MSALAERLAAYAQLRETQHLAPVKISAFYQKKIDEEVAALGHHDGPLSRAMLPSDDKLKLHAPGEVADWVDDRSNMAGAAKDIFIQKYRDRVLFTPTSTCASHCLYCFREDVLAEQRDMGRGVLESKLGILTAHLAQHPEISEVILSGGDPLTMNYDEWQMMLARLAAVKTITSIRLHTRAPVFAPDVLKDERKIALLAQYNVRFVWHIIHPYEICDAVVDVMQRLHAAGVRQYNHFPLLRGVNDHADVLVALLRRLDALNIRNLSIYVPEPIRFSAAYRVNFARMGQLMDEVVARTPSWINSFRFCLDSPVGKVRRENLVRRDADRLVFVREGQEVIYPDFPVAMDVPGRRDVLLWKDA